MIESHRYQNLASFTMPENFRGRPAWLVQIWWIVQSTLFGCSPQIFYGWRRFLLRLFGAQIGRGVIIRPTARITYPWKLKIGDHAWVGDHVALYTLGEITIGDNAVVSQNSYLCTGSHDDSKPSFDIYAKSIIIEPQAWVATDVFIAPGVTIGTGAVIGARSSVFKNIPPGMVAIGAPARVIGPRRSSGD
jgi:putative colanic acid biosynthesis acetyltransferase WcaF